jgi:hypothetical protein
MNQELVVIAIKTDQPNAVRRMEAVLAAMHPIEEAPAAEVIALELGHMKPAPNALSANAYEHLRGVFGQEAMDRLGVGDVIFPEHARRT